jgi:hypothetical protein
MSADGETAVPTLHVEVFCSPESAKAIDLDAHAEFFRTPQRSRSSSLQVQTQDILNIFRDADTIQPYSDIQVFADKKIEPDEIRNFYRNESSDPGEESFNEFYRDQFRRSMTYHVSEWSDKVDWVSTLLQPAKGGDPLPWSSLERGELKKRIQEDRLFTQEIRKFVPFTWLTEKVAKGIGLVEGEWNGRLYHFHPLAFLMWVSFQASRRKEQYRTKIDLAKLRRKNARRRVIDNIVRVGRKLVDKKLPEDTRKQYAREYLSWLEEAGEMQVAGKVRKRKKLRGRNRRLNNKLRAKVLWPYETTSDGDEVRRKRPPKKDSSDYKGLRVELFDRIVKSEYDEDYDGDHGFVESEDDTYATPKEALQELFDTDSPYDWRLIQPEEADA